jgi:hypothetical protein
MPTTIASTSQTRTNRITLTMRTLRVPTAWKEALVAWLAQHVLLAGCFALGIRYGSHVTDVVTAWRILLVGWDGKDIAAVAAHGYLVPRDAAFYPLYPLLEHLTAPFFAGHFALAGWVIASLSALGAFGMLRILVEAETGNQTIARYALFFAAFSPFAVFLGLAYTEPLFLLLALLTFHALRRRSWLAAGVFAALASLTRGAGVSLLVPLAVEAFVALGAGWTPRFVWRPAVALALPLIAVAGYWLVQARIYGVPFAASRAEMVYWTRGIDWPWYGPLQTFGVLLAHGDPGFTFRAALDLVALAVALALAVPLAFPSARRRLGMPPSLCAFTWAVLLLTLSVPLHPTDGSDAMFSQPRYLLVAFPLAVVAAAAAVSSRPVRLALVAASLLSYALLMTLYAAGVGIG